MKLREQGYDGTFQSRRGDEYVAFEPNQIKSVDNKGTFDSKSDNIYLKESKTDDKYTAKLVKEHNETAETIEKLEKDLEKWGEDISKDIQRKEDYSDAIQETDPDIKALSKNTSKTPPRFLTKAGEKKLDETDMTLEEAQYEIDVFLERKG